MTPTFSVKCTHAPGNRIPDVNGLTQCKACGCIILEGHRGRFETMLSRAVSTVSPQARTDDGNAQGGL